MSSNLMPTVRQTAVRIVLSTAEQQGVARSRTELRDLVRARIVLAAAARTPNAQLAVDLKLCEDTVRKWRDRFGTHRLIGLRDLPRSGRPRVFGDTVEAAIKALGCARPTESDVPLSRWSATELATEAVARNIVNSAQHAPSASSISRWLHADAIKPWQCRSWIFPRDTEFGQRPVGSWTCSNAAGTVAGSVTTSTSSAPTRSPSSKPSAPLASREGLVSLTSG